MNNGLAHPVLHGVISNLAMYTYYTYSSCKHSNNMLHECTCTAVRSTLVHLCMPSIVVYLELGPFKVGNMGIYLFLLILDLYYSDHEKVFFDFWKITTYFLEHYVFQ